MAQAVRTIGFLAAASLAATLAAPATAQVTPGSQQWLGLRGASIPPILKQVQANPYREPVTPACDSIPQEILALDKVLGPDVDGKQPKTGKIHMAINYVRGMIPYRGYVRFLTQADSKDKALQRAVTAGFARRAFLRGLEAHMQCAPSADTQVADASDRVADVEPAKVAVAKLDLPRVESPKVEVADARPRVEPVPVAAPGDELAQQMLTPVRTAPPPPPAAPAPPPATPVSTHVVYRLVDSVSGRPIVPDDPVGR
ncbi:MAG TPA: hypothetical protein VFE18_06485 [Phenylobacterium sp.]|jgi:hypothetical protein|uniref:hypothetical protein n=1 Tax=Phenylobacterium sp. TaxID=1871053 RepID=UPI002D45F103|nr:hypothetical protein [Phenylobacterium sp.]HZZ67801.1 hypothetical protein [Phenylobacterium sp.]